DVRFAGGLEQSRSVLDFHNDPDRLGRECDLAGLRSVPGGSDGTAVRNLFAGPPHKWLAAPLCNGGAVPHGFGTASSGGILRHPWDGWSDLGEKNNGARCDTDIPKPANQSHLL